MTDEQLVKKAQEGDKQALETLLIRYKSKVLATARRFFLCGGETEDLVQEGMIGLYSAINSYREGKSSFSTFSYHCIRNRIVDAVKLSNGQKHQAINHFQPIVEVGEELYDIEQNEPEEALIIQENKKEFLLKISKHLSSFEFKVIVMYTDGMTVLEISEAMQKTPKSIGNAITRSRIKLQKLFEV